MSHRLCETDRVGRVEVLAPFPRCLHCPVLVEYLFSVDIGAEQSVGKQTYLWHRGNYCALMGDLSLVDWGVEFMHFSAAGAYEVFLEVLRNLIDLYVLVSLERKKISWSVNPSRELKNRRAHMWRNYKSLRARFGRRGLRALEAVDRFNGVNPQF